MSRTNRASIINSHVWFRKDDISYEFLRDLSSKLKVTSKFDAEVEVDCLEDSGTHYGVPIHFAETQLSSSLRDVKDSRPPVDIPSSVFENIDTDISLGGSPSWDWQIDTVPRLVKRLREDRRAILKAPCGAGKTRAALAVAASMKVPTLIVVDRSFLANQWKKNINDLFDIPMGDIGHVQQDLCDFEDRPFTVVMAQSLMDRGTGYERYPEEFYNAFGLVIFDELHSFAAPKINRVMRVVNAGARLGLSATPFRADGLERVYSMHLGDKIEEVSIERPSPTILHLNIGDLFSTLPLDIPKARMINLMTGTGRPSQKQIKEQNIPKSKWGESVPKPNHRSDKRNSIIALEIQKAANKGRKILVLSDRVAHLKQLEMLMDEIEPGITQDYFIGKKSQEELDQAEEAQVIYATYTMAAQAMDIKSLDTLFLATPRSDVEQAVGRIMRTDPSKKPPVVVDIVDPRFASSCNSRLMWYYSQGYQVNSYNVSLGPK